MEPFAFLPSSFITSGGTRWATDPPATPLCACAFVCVFVFLSASRKLITTINCEHQQSVKPGPTAFAPTLKLREKVLIQGRAGEKRAAAELGPPSGGSPSLWQPNKKQCKLLIGSLIIDAVFTTIWGWKQKKGERETMCRCQLQGLRRQSGTQRNTKMDSTTRTNFFFWRWG